MFALLSLLISLVLGLLCTVIPWWVRQIKTWQILVIFGISLVLWILGAALSLGWYPWTNIVDFLVAVGAGVLLGRVIPAKFWPFFIFLLVMSALDVTQILLSTHTSAAAQSASIPAGEYYSNFLLQLPWGAYHLGPFDLLILAAMGTYWARRGGALLAAYVGAVIGLIAGYGVLLAAPDTLLPLIPFLTLGWLCSVGVNRARQQPAAKTA